MTGLGVRGLKVHSGNVRILRDVSFRAPAGAVTGLIGPNGAGKSTLIGALAGLRRIAGGEMLFDDHNLGWLAPSLRARLLAHVEQTATTSERLRVRDVVALGRIPFQAAWQSDPTPDDEGITDAAIADMGIAAFAGRLYHTLSGGEQQRVQLARALAQQPRLLLLDEPTSHLDIAAQLQVLRLLQQRAHAGCTVLIALHDLNLAARFCDHLLVLRHGEVAAEGAPAGVLSSALLRDVYRVEARVMRLPDIFHPVVVFDDAVETASATKSD